MTIAFTPVHRPLIHALLALAAACSLGHSSALAVGSAAPSLAELQARAAKGDALAETGLGRRYLEGDGVLQDFAMARKFLQAAANQGDPMGMGLLGLIYVRGKGVPIDIAQGLSWISKAAAKGDTSAMSDAAFLYGNGLGPAKLGQDLLNWLSAVPANKKADIRGQLFRQFIKRGDLAGVKTLVKLDPQLLDDKRPWDSVLTKAIYARQPSLVAYFSQSRAWADEFFRSALNTAVYSGDTASFRQLLGQHKYSQDELQYFFAQAISGAEPQIADLLIQAGANPRQQLDDGNNFLFMEAGRSTPKMLTYLLGKGLSLKARNHRQETPLFVAAKQGNSGIIEFMLANGAEIDAIDSQGDTPLGAAMAEGKVANMNYLLAKGANPSLVDKNGETALFAAVRNNRSEILAELSDSYYLADLKKDFAADRRNQAGDNLLNLAIKSDADRVIPKLLQWDCFDLLKKNAAGLTSVDLVNARLKALAPEAEFRQHWQGLLQQTNEQSFTDKLQRVSQLFQERGQLYSNMHTLQVMVETYAVDWAGAYPSNLAALSAEAQIEGRSYWMALTNPITHKTGIADVYIDPKGPKLGPTQVGKVYFDPVKDVIGVIHKYFIYGIDHSGNWIKLDDKTFILTNS